MDAKFDKAIAQMDAANATDPNQDDGQPRELLYAKRLTDWVLTLSPEASPVLRLAARSQHIRRWEIPRSSYPMTKPGYLRWRAELKQFHARATGEILTEAGYNLDLIQNVQSLNLKKNFPSDPEAQTLEDALCLVFLQFQLSELVKRTEPDKVVNALKKSWAKMSPRAREHALKLPYRTAELALIQQALTS